MRYQTVVVLLSTVSAFAVASPEPAAKRPRGCPASPVILPNLCTARQVKLGCACAFINPNGPDQSGRCDTGGFCALEPPVIVCPHNPVTLPFEHCTAATAGCACQVLLEGTDDRLQGHCVAASTGRSAFCDTLGTSTPLAVREESVERRSRRKCPKQPITIPGDVCNAKQATNGCACQFVDPSGVRDTTPGRCVFIENQPICKLNIPTKRAALEKDELVERNPTPKPQPKCPKNPINFDACTKQNANLGCACFAASAGAGTVIFHGKCGNSENGPVCNLKIPPPQPQPTCPTKPVDSNKCTKQLAALGCECQFQGVTIQRGHCVDEGAGPICGFHVIGQ